MATETPLSLPLGQDWEIAFAGSDLLTAEFRLGTRAGQVLKLTLATGEIAEAESGYVVTVEEEDQADLDPYVYGYEIWGDGELIQYGSLDVWGTLRDSTVEPEDQPLTGVAAGVGAASGALEISAELGGAAAGVGAATGELTNVVGVSLAGVAAGVGTAAGDLLSHASVLAIIAGQSNATARGTDGETPPVKYAALTDAYVWDGSDFVAYVVGTTSGTPEYPDTWGTEAEFIYQMNLNHPGTPVYVVKHSIGSTPLATDSGPDWNPANGELYGDLETKVVNARAWLDTEGVVIANEVSAWCQGEADMTDPAYAAAYEANFTALLAAWRTDISDGLFVCERTRLPGHELSDLANGYIVREAQHDAINADGNAAIISLDFEENGFAVLHPPPSWVEGKGLRVYAAYEGTYTATFGDIEDTSAIYSFTDVSEADVSSLIASNVSSVTGIERAATVTLSGGEVKVFNSDDTVAVDWTAGPTEVNKYQKVQLRQTTSASYETLTSITVTIGGVADTWSITTGEEFPSYDADTQAVLDKITSIASPALSGAHAAALDDFVLALKAASIWADFNVLYLHGIPSDSAAGRINIRSPAGSLATLAGTPLWSATEGFSPNATTGNSIDLGFSPSAFDGTNRNSIALGAWFSGISANGSYDFRSGAGTGNLFGMYRRSDGSWRINLNSPNGTMTGLATVAGFHLAARTASNLVTGYGPAGTSLGTLATASGAAAATDVFLGHNVAPPSNDYIAASWINTASIDATKAQAMRDAFNALGLAWGWTGAV